ncbi:DUF2520 domain-containing protein [Halpernia sp. GG3]
MKLFKRLYEISPKDAQTGPAIREDDEVLKSHEKLIIDQDAKAIFEVMNNSIKNMYKK